MRPVLNRIIAVAGLLALSAVFACSGGNGDDPPASQPGLVLATPTANVAALTDADLARAAELSGLALHRFDTAKRTDDGLTVSIVGLKVLEVGQTGWFSIRVTNDSESYAPESPFSVTQTKGTVISGGPITVDSARASDLLGVLTLEPTETEESPITVTCNDTGAASITFQSTGQSNLENPPETYSVTVDWNFECVEDDGDPLTNDNFVSLTEGRLGFPATDLNWVTFDQGGVILRVNQIEPSKLAVGDSVEIFADFDARVAAGYTGFGAAPEQLNDADLSFTSGGPVNIDSSPVRQADPAVLRVDGAPIVFWGFRSATLTCTEVGEGVYHANLNGKRGTGAAVSQTVSGLVDCVEPSDEGSSLIADELDFSGAWARKPRPDGGYVPTGRDEFPNNTEVYFDSQLCVARVSGIRACDVAYWIYGTDWFELTRQGDPAESRDSAGNPVFTTEYSGVFHHTHSFFGRTEIPDELLRSDRPWGDAWDLSAGPTSYTFEMTGTLTYAPNWEKPLQLVMSGSHVGDIAFTHGKTVNVTYYGPVPQDGMLSASVSFRDEVRADSAPEGMYRGSDQAYQGPFYSASMQTDGVVTGTVRPASVAENVDAATVEIFVPGSDTPLASTVTGPGGKFKFTGLPVVRVDGDESEPPGVYGIQYQLRISDAESQVDGLPLLFQDKTVTVRPFVDLQIQVEPVPATHFIAVGDRGVAGTPIVYHYSLEYWDCGGRFAPLHNSDGYAPDDVVRMCWDLNPRAQPRKLGGVELLARTGWNAWGGVDNLLDDGRSWIEEGVWIAEIVYEGIAATEIMPIYAGTETEVQQKWDEIIQIANNYPWAEQSGFAENGAFTNWPMSMYDPLGTNSNTFIRYLVESAGLKMTEMDGSHPGNMVPVQNVEHDLTRLITFYPDHTPWKEEDPEPEPTGSPS